MTNLRGTGISLGNRRIKSCAPGFLPTVEKSANQSSRRITKEISRAGIRHRRKSHRTRGPEPSHQENHGCAHSISPSGYASS